MNLIGYLRVSTKKQITNGFEGIETQRNIIKNYVKNMYNHENIIYYEEIGSSYNDSDKLVKLLDCIKKNNYILVSDITRFGRNITQLHKYLNLATKKKCKIHSILENITYGNNKVEDTEFMIKTFQSVQYSNILSEKIKNSIHRRKENGEHIGKAPFGYIKINKKLVKHKKQQETILKINELLKMKYKYLDIAKILNNEKANLKKWTTQTVKNIVKKNNYILQNYTILNEQHDESIMEEKTQINENTNIAKSDDFELLDDKNKKTINELSLSSLDTEIQKIVREFNKKRILNKKWEDRTIMEMIENTKLPNYFK